MPAVKRPAIAGAIIALALGATAACGGSTGSSISPANATTPSTSTADAAAVALLPASIKSAGKLTVAADASYAPNEFLASNGTTVIGMDADLAAALGKELGLTVTVKNVTFDAIIPALQDGRYDLGMSSFTDTLARQKQVNFVTYFSAGTSFFVKSTGGPTINTLADLCGHKVAVESGTTEEDDAKGQIAKCTAAGKAADTVLPYNTQSEANVALNAGRADVGMADSPVAAYQVAKSNGAFKISGQPYGTAPYGIAVPKSAGTLDKAVLAALKDLISDGTYTQILTHWGIQAGGITDPVINGATS